MRRRRKKNEDGGEKSVRRDAFGDEDQKQATTVRNTIEKHTRENVSTK